MAYVQQDPEPSDLFGEVISRYSDEEAVEDGMLVKVGDITNGRGDRVTAAVWATYTRDFGGIITDITRLKAVWLEVATKGRPDSGALSRESGWRALGEGPRALWLVPNELGGRTLMFAEDY